LQHASLSVSGEFQTAVLFLNDHREEAMLFQIGPQLWRQIGHFMGDGKVVRHTAGFFHRAVNKGLFFGGQARLRIVMQLFPVRVARNRSPSHQVVPASIASFSVRDIGGITLRKRGTPAQRSLIYASGKVKRQNDGKSQIFHRPATPSAAVQARKSGCSGIN
jgi:hypothetical protein